MRNMWGIIFLVLFNISCLDRPPEKEKVFIGNYNLDSLYEKEKQKVKRVIDGDTFELENGERVRLLGIDTPEKWESNKLDKDAEISNKDKEVIKALGYLASMYADSILYGKEVTLIRDSTNSDRDKYNRLLRYAYLESGEMFNLKIIQDGYAFAYTKYPFIYMEEFRKAEREARENERGLWGNIDFLEMDSE